MWAWRQARGCLCWPLRCTASPVMKKLLWVVVIAGCAAHVPALRLERSQAAIRSADELGAGQLPAASVFLQRARDEQEAARRLSNAGDPRAPTVLACAEADADLALALTHEAAARRDEMRSAAAVAALRAEGARP